MPAKRVLGKGLDSMIPKKQIEKTPSTSKEKAVRHSETSDNKENDLKNEEYVKLSKVEPNKEQPRKDFNEDALQELAESIRQFGVLQPLLVTDKGTHYEIIAGERRWRAARLAGLTEIPVIVREYTNEEIVEISLIENIQREDLNAIEEALAYKRLIDEFGLKQDEVAEKVSKSRTAITNSMRLLKLSEKVKQMVIDEMISPGHARALLAVNEPEVQETLAARIFDEKLSVRETEQIVKKLTEQKKKTSTSKKTDPAEEAVYKSLEERMKQIVGSKVIIQKRQNNKGRIEIEYYSKEDLERIIDLFESIG